MEQPVVRVSAVDEWCLEPELLTDAETQRWQRLRQPADREAYLAAHVLVRHVAAQLLDTTAERLVLRQSCPRCGGTDHGRPRIEGHPGLHVSLSHARGVVAALAATSPCGIDIEPHPAGGVPAGTLTARERSWVEAQPDPATAFTTLWTRKEAWAKASGEDLDRAVAKDVLGAGWVSGELQTEEYGAAWVVL